MNPEEYAELARRIRPAFRAKMHAEKLADCLEDSLCRVYLSLAHWVHGQKPADKPLLLGVNGAQGSGKTTLCAFLRFILADAYGYNAL